MFVYTAVGLACGYFLAPAGAAMYAASNTPNLWVFTPLAKEYLAAQAYNTTMTLAPHISSGVSFTLPVAGKVVGKTYSWAFKRPVAPEQPEPQAPVAAAA